MPCSRPTSRLSGALAVGVLVTAGVAHPADTTCPGIEPAPVNPAAPATAPACASGKNDCFDVTTDESEYDTRTGNTSLKGNVTLRQGEREIHADHVEYDAEDVSVKIKGKVEYLDPLVRVRGNGGNYSADGGADIGGAQFELRSRPGRGAAGNLTVSPEGVIDLERVKFTTCPSGDEAWRISAGHITLNTQEQLGIGRNARVVFKGVPIIYLPWLSFPLGSARKSGFLFPSVGHTNRSGFQTSVPYYWNIAPQADLTFEPVYYGQRGFDLGGQFRYLTQRQHGSLNVNYLPDDQLRNESRHRLSLDHIAELPRGFRFTLDAQTVSDSDYFEDFGQGPEGTSIAFLERFAQLRYRDEHWLFSAEAQHFQTIDEALLADERPYARLPRIVANADFGLGASQQLRYGFDSEVVNFHRSIGEKGWRFDASPKVALDLGGAGYFLRPSLAWRHTQYQLEDRAPGADSSPSRNLPIASLDTGLVFERAAGSHHQRRVTLEPRLLYVNIPFREQDDLPVFDTALPDLNLVQLFRTNRYVGADRVSDADQVSVGVTTRLFDAEDGRQFLAATLGQVHYFETPRVLLPGETRRDSDSSDVIAQLALTAFEDWNADIGLQWNPEESRKERAQVRLQYQPGPERVVNLGYRFQRDRPLDLGGPVVSDRLEQAEISGAWPLTQRWNVFARYVHSFPEDTSIERFAGIEYRSCCWRLRAFARRFVSKNTGEQDTGIYLQLELTGLASVGSAADAFLSSTVRGYSRPEPPH